MTSAISEAGDKRSALNELFVVLSNPIRRRILVTLVELDEEGGYDAETFAPEDADVVLFRHELYHQHYPRLAEAGLLDWDRESNAVTRGPQFEDVAPAIELLDENADLLPGEWP